MTANPACVRMSDSMVRMKTASSQITTVRSMDLLKKRPLSFLCEQPAQDPIRVQRQEGSVVECANADQIIAIDVVRAQRVAVEREHARNFARNCNDLIDRGSDPAASNDENEQAMIGFRDRRLAP